MDLRERLDLVTRAPGAGATGGKVRNITCVMQELGYIDHNLEPNYEKITERISNLPVSSELKGDIQDGLQFCQKFSVSNYLSSLHLHKRFIQRLVQVWFTSTRYVAVPRKSFSWSKLVKHL